MHIKICLLIFLMLFILKEDVLAQTDHSPSIGVGIGGHNNITGHDTLSKGAVLYTFFNFPFDQAQRFNWETSFHILQFIDSEGKNKVSLSIMYIGLKFYILERDFILRPYLSAGISGVENLYYFSLPVFNGSAGIDYAINNTYSLHLQLSSLSTGLTVKDGNIIEKDIKHRTTAILLGLRYQL